MSQWARANPDRMAEIAGLPLREQVGAMRDSMPVPYVGGLEDDHQDQTPPDGFTVCGHCGAYPSKALTACPLCGHDIHARRS